MRSIVKTYRRLRLETLEDRSLLSATPMEWVVTDVPDESLVGEILYDESVVEQTLVEETLTAEVGAEEFAGEVRMYKGELADGETYVGEAIEGDWESFSSEVMVEPGDENLEYVDLKYTERGGEEGGDPNLFFYCFMAPEDSQRNLEDPGLSVETTEEMVEDWVPSDEDLMMYTMMVDESVDVFPVENTVPDEFLAFSSNVVDVGGVEEFEAYPEEWYDVTSAMGGPIAYEFQPTVVVPVVSEEPADNSAVAIALDGGEETLAAQETPRAEDEEAFTQPLAAEPLGVREDATTEDRVESSKEDDAADSDEVAAGVAVDVEASF